jgi:hypothetical protein
VEALNESILDLSEYGTGKARFPGSFIFNAVQALKMARLPASQKPQTPSEVSRVEAAEAMGIDLGSDYEDPAR